MQIAPEKITREDIREYQRSSHTTAYANDVREGRQRNIRSEEKRKNFRQIVVTAITFSTEWVMLLKILCALAGGFVMNQTSHKSSAMMRRYIREGSLFIENAAAGVGL